MKKMIAPIVLIIFMFLAISCAGSKSEDPTEAVGVTQTPAILADTFFSGCAVLDENQNGIRDAGEPLLEGMMFTIELASGGGFQGKTYEGQCAFITIPSALPEGAWPVLAGISMPDDSPYELSSPAEISLERYQFRADFLFTEK